MSTKVILRNVRLSYANVWEPRTAEDGAKPKYSASLIIPKTDTSTIAAIRAAIKEAIGSAETKLKIPGPGDPRRDAIISRLKTPLRDGDLDRPDDEAYTGSYFINAASTNKPGIVDAQVNPILDRAEVYSGCYANVSVNFYAYNTNGNRGIAAGLNNLQKVRDGEPLGGAAPASADFTPVSFTEDADDFLS